MKARWFIAFLGGVVATLVIVAILVMAQEPKETVPIDGDFQRVVVPTQRIEEGEPLDPLIKQGIFAEIQIPAKALVPGALTEIRALEGTRATEPIRPNEQIPSDALTPMGPQVP